MLRDLIPHTHRGRGTGLRARDFDHPFDSFRREIDRMFDDVWEGRFAPVAGRRGGFDAFAAKVDIAEDDKRIEIAAELPGLEENDVKVTLENGVLTIEGEKKTETEEKEEDKRYHVMERSYGSFRRVFNVGDGIDDENVGAAFKNGVLTVTLPKTETVQAQAKQIDIKSS